jgi:hypothetical protein
MGYHSGFKKPLVWGQGALGYLQVDGWHLLQGAYLFQGEVSGAIDFVVVGFRLAAYWVQQEHNVQAVADVRGAAVADS